MISSESVFFGSAYQGDWLLGQDESGDSGSGFSLSDIGGAFKKAGEVAKQGSDLYKSVTGGSKTPSVGTKAPTVPGYKLADGVTWEKSKVVIAQPLCKAQYEALLKRYKQRTTDEIVANVHKKTKAGTPLSQSDVTVIKWIRTAGQRLDDFRSMYGEVDGKPTKWPTTCPPGTGVGIPGYKGGILGSGISTKYVYAGIGVLALGAVAWWMLK